MHTCSATWNGVTSRPTLNMIILTIQVLQVIFPNYAAFIDWMLISESNLLPWWLITFLGATEATRLSVGAHATCFRVHCDLLNVLEEVVQCLAKPLFQHFEEPKHDPNIIDMINK